jgi:hypothetical protein
MRADLYGMYASKCFLFCPVKWATQLATSAYIGQVSAIYVGWPANSAPVVMRHTKKGAFMARGATHTPEQIVRLLWQIEVTVANGKTMPSACREGGITVQTYHRWRKSCSRSSY